MNFLLMAALMAALAFGGVAVGDPFTGAPSDGDGRWRTTIKWGD
jgi:hypothetical protein